MLFPTPETSTMPCVRPLGRAAINTAVKLERPPTVQSPDVRSKRLMMPRMVAMRHQLKVLDSVVALIPIDVVNIFVRSQRTPKIVRHDQPVFRQHSALLCVRMFRSIHVPIALCSHYIGLAFTFHRAVKCGTLFDARRVSQKRLAATSTDAFNAVIPRRHCAGAGAESAFATSDFSRRDRESRAAVLTGTLYGHGSPNLSCRAGSVRSTARLYCARFPRPQANFTMSVQPSMDRLDSFRGL